MHRHLSKDRGVSELTCPVVFDINHKLTCAPPPSFDELKTPVVYTVDHVYPGINIETAPTVIMYAELGTAACTTAHKDMLARAERGEVKYVFRHRVPEGEGKVRLSGYGVELQVKSTEYKAQDDTKLEGDDGSNEDDEAGDEEIEGQE